MNEVEVLRPFLIRLAEASGALIEKYFLSSSLQVDLKADRTVVTQADREAEDLIRTMIRKEFPNHGIIGEEYGNENEQAEFVWIIDPIDGTISFVGGVPLFGSLIGLLHKGQPILGCIHQPVSHLLCIGDNQQTVCNGKPVRVRPCSDISAATLLTTDVASFSAFRNLSRFEELRQEAKLFRTWGDCYGYLLLAMGKADVMLDPIMNPWDLLPLIPVVRGAGGMISGWGGADPVKSNSCIAASPELHPYIVQKLGS